MTDPARSEILDLIDRLSRISAAEHWVGDLNPAQLAALSYLSKANRYSRAPSQIAEYLSAMRGTVSGTLKALLRKGLVKEQKSKTDRRRTSLSITSKGLRALEFETAIDVALDNMSGTETAQLAGDLKNFLKRVLRARDDRSFGICHSCRHHRKGVERSFCTLLDVSLRSSQTHQICFEHENAA